MNNCVYIYSPNTMDMEPTKIGSPFLSEPGKLQYDTEEKLRAIAKTEWLGDKDAGLVAYITLRDHAKYLERQWDERASRLRTEQEEKDRKLREAIDLLIATEQSGGDLWWKAIEQLKALRPNT